MAIAVEDFPSLLRILDEHPEWRDELRRRMLDEEFLKLPDWVRQNSRDIQALKESIEASRVAFEARFANVESDISTLKGDVSEMKWKDKFTGRFGHIVRRARRATARDLEPFEDALDDGLIGNAEANAVRLLDMIIRGVRGTGDEREDVFLAVEISMTIDEHDITRAIERAAILRKVGYNAVPVVAGTHMDARLRDSAVARGVEVVFGD